MGIVQKNLIGIEISARHVKMVKVNGKGKITDHAYAELPDNVIQNGRVESKQMLTETLKQARQKLGISFRDCVLCADSADAIIRQITIPQMEEEYIRNNIALELSGYLPISSDRYMIDYIITDRIDTEPKQYQLLVFAVPADTLQVFTACIKAAGLKLRYVDIMENAYEKLHRMLRSSNVTHDSEFACLYLDHARTSVSVFGNGRFFISKAIDSGVTRICKEIAEKTGRSPEAARNLLFTNDILNSVDLFAAEKAIIEKNLKDISLDVIRVLDYYKSRNKDSSIGAIYLSGGLASVAGIPAALQNMLGIPAISVSDYLEPMFRAAPGRHNGVDYTNAIAVTLREESLK